MIPDALRGPLFGRLGFRLMAAVALAMTPLAFLAYVQTENFEKEAQARWQSALFGETLLAATGQLDKISRARGIAASTAGTISSTLADAVACRALMRGIVKSEPAIVFAGFIPVDGNMVCGSKGGPRSFAGSQALHGLTADPRPMMTVNPKGAISGESVLIFSHPVVGADGKLAGFVSLSLPHRALERRNSVLLDPDQALTEPLALITFGGDGTVLTAAHGMDAADGSLPADRELVELAGTQPITFLANTRSGTLRTFAVVAVVPGTLYVLGSWPASAASVSPFAGLLPLWAFPLMMWLASLLAAWLAAERQVLAPIRSLRRSIIAFAGGERLVAPPDLTEAPNELRDVGAAYLRMTRAVLHDEAELENALLQKEVLLREVHHRVKNNLQLIASIMNLQMRKSVVPEAQQMLKGLHDRVMSLATVHRELYQTSGLTDVQADELLASIVAQVMRMGTGADRRFDTRTSLARIRLTPDQAVPLSLILTEALTNALKHSGASDTGRTALDVTLEAGELGEAVLTVANTAPATGPVHLSPGLESTGLGQELLEALATQLSGTLTVGVNDGLYTVRVAFPLHDLSPTDTSEDEATEEG